MFNAVDFLSCEICLYNYFDFLFCSATPLKEREENTDSPYIEDVREKINQKATRPGNLNAS